MSELWGIGIGKGWRTALLLRTVATAAIATPAPALARDPAPAEAPAAAPAADTDDQNAGDIVVTAQRRESRIQDTPLAVNAFGSDALRDESVRRINDLAGLAAGVNIPNQSLGTQAIFIRGIGTTRPIGNPSVGIYIDDIYIPRSFGTGWYGSLPDLDRIEVLHGPQGTLYGQSSDAGAVKFVSITPGRQTRAWGEFGYGSYDAIEGRGYVAGGLTDTLSASVAYAHTEQGGPDYNATLKRPVGAIQNDAVRGILHLAPSSATDVVLSADYLRDRSEYRTADPLNVAGAAPYTTFSDINPRQKFDGGGVTLHISQDVGGGITLRSITGYRAFHMFLPTDTDGRAQYISGFKQDLRQQQVSEELQLLGTFNRLTLTAGVLGYYETFDVYRLSWANNAFSVIDSKNRTTSFGAYAQGDYRITDTLTLTLGARLSYDRNAMDALGYASTVAGARGATTFDVTGLTKDFTSVVPRVAVSWQPSKEFLAYASFSQGRTAGGWNAAPGNATVARIPIGQEKVSAYEIGIKAGTRDHLLQGSLAAFYNDYGDYQASITNPIIGGQVITGSVIQNAGDAHIYGLEAELAAKPTSRFSATLSLTFMRSAFDTYSNPTGAAASNYVGQALPYVPEFTGGLRLAYTLPLGEKSNLRFVASGRHESSSYSTINTTREFNKFPRQDYIDGQIAYALPGGHWTLSVEGKNLADKAYVLPVSGAYAPAQGLNGVSYAMPRTVMGRIRYDF